MLEICDSDRISSYKYFGIWVVLILKKTHKRLYYLLNSITLAEISWAKNDFSSSFTVLE